MIPFTLSKNHWLIENYTQRINYKEWRKILLCEGDKIMVNGKLRYLQAKSLGYGVLEISKVSLQPR